MFLKFSTNLISITHKLEVDNHWGVDILVKELNSRLNPNMNDLMAIDYAIRDLIDDTDYMLPRNQIEFPRISTEYKSKRRD